MTKTMSNVINLCHWCSSSPVSITLILWWKAIIFPIMHRIDIQTNTRLFQSLFHAQRDIFLLLSRFPPFYNSADRLESFLRHCPTFPNAFFVGGPSDIFVTELTDQLLKLKVEPVLLHYLSEINILQGMELIMTTSTRLKSCLYSFRCPGGPMYPTRSVRHAAWQALDLLFPVGRYPRHLISLFFRFALSVVLALLLLELCNFLREGNLLLLDEIDIF